MELIINIKEEQKAGFFLKLLQEFDFIEVTEIKEDGTVFPEEHKKLLEERLKRIENDETNFRAWDDIKQKYEKKTI
jgi:hypothetical protein